MARKNNGNETENNAEIKILYFEAKNISPDLASTINALTNAIKTAPVQIVPHQPNPPQIESRKPITNGNGQTAMSLDEDEEVENVTTNVENSSAPKRPTREKKPYKGTILDDIPWDGAGTPFIHYVKQKDPSGLTKRYLVIAAWFKRHGGKDTVNSNLIYNAYRKMGWSTPDDITQPFRDGSKSMRGYYRSDGKGYYAITGIGLDAADKVGNEKSESEG